VADLEDDFDYMCRVMSETRPTAVNLFWAIERMRETFRREKTSGKIRKRSKRAWWKRPAAFFAKTSRLTGRWDASEPNCFQTVTTVLTHCNAGALALPGLRTALGVIRGAIDAGKRIAVIADETRPFLQG